MCGCVCDGDGDGEGEGEGPSWMRDERGLAKCGSGHPATSQGHSRVSRESLFGTFESSYNAIFHVMDIGGNFHSHNPQG